jgi:radical SAM superfamily enzyme YgiQ (UPF0313 family)
VSRIVLANANLHIVDREKDHYSVMEHLGLGMIASVLERDGHDVTIVDCYARNWDNDRAVEEIVRLSPDLLGLTANYSNFESTVEIATRTARERPGVFVFAGGEHCTYSAEEILARYPAFRAVVRGEGEETVREVAARAPDLSGVSGVYFRDREGRVVRAPDRPGVADLDALPFARRSTLDECQTLGVRSAIGVLAQRGCNFDCSFCNAHTFLRLGGGEVVRQRSPENVVEELLALKRRYFDEGNVEKVYFYDANFITGSARSKQWARRLAELMIATDAVMPFEVFMRGDSLDPDDDDLVALLKQAGLEAVFIGIESFSESDLQVLHKRISPRRMQETLELLGRHGVLGPTAGVIMFNPYSTDASLLETAQLLERYEYASFWNLSQKLQIFPGVALLRTLRGDELIRGYDSSAKVYSYRFRDPAIEELSEHLLRLNDDKAVIRDNALPRHVKTELFRLLGRAASAGISSHDLDEIVAGVRAAIRENNRVNVRYFEDAVALNRAEGCRRSVTARTAAYLEDLSHNLDHLEGAFGRALSDLHAYVERC